MYIYVHISWKIDILNIKVETEYTRYMIVAKNLSRNLRLSKCILKAD